MTYAMTLNNINFTELTNEEMMAIDGGANWDRVFAGTSFFLATLAFVATAPVTAPVVAIAVVSSAVAGAYTGYGLVSK